MEILSVKNLTKKYGNIEVLKNVNMHIQEGEIYGLIGKNGAGKTTLIKTILGLTEITDGEICFWEKSGKNNLRIYNRIGASLDFQVFANIRGITKKNAIDEVLEKVGLISQRDKKYKQFSLGMKKRLGLANAIMHEPEFIILDEPTNGLDPIGIADFRKYLMKISKEEQTTIMISSHLLSEVSIMADRIGILNNGVLIVEKPIEEIQKSNRKYLKISVTNVELTCGVLEEIFKVEDYEVIDREQIYIYELQMDKKELSKELAKHGVGIMEMKIEEENLEDYFRKLVEN